MATGNILAEGNTDRLKVITVAFDPFAIGAATTAEVAATVPGVLPGDFVWVNKPNIQAGLGIAGCRVTQANTVAVTFVNATAGSINPPLETYLFMVLRPDATLNSF